jgi:RNA polymerase sigma-70 factor (ECF subfamily)
MDVGEDRRNDESEPTRPGAAGPAIAVRELPLGDTERLGALLAALEPRLLSVAQGYTRDPDAARDVVQNAFEKVVRHGSRFRGGSRVSTWVHRIVVNESLMWLRTQRRRREDPAEERLAAAAVDRSPSPAELLERRQDVQRIRRGIGRLGHEDRDLVRRCALEGQSYAEYGRRRGLHPAAVKSRAYRARRHLADLLHTPEAS